MKNLAEFKRRLVETHKNGGTINYQFKSLTKYDVGNPMRELYPEGKFEGRVQNGHKIGRVQSNAFTRILDNGKESWLDFGKATDWRFEDGIAINHSASYKGSDHECITELFYSFDKTF